MNYLFKSALLVEDEPHLATALKAAMKKMNILTYHASNLTEAKQLYRKHNPEFILLDRTLPDGEGLDLCEDLRRDQSSARVLVLTASGKTEDRVKGLDRGADDYLAKPFSWEELQARIRALARRKPEGNQPPPTLWKRDQARLSILGPKGWVVLTLLEFNLASSLIEQEGKIVSRSDLLKDVWGFTWLPKTRTVDHFLGRLRKLFEEDSEKPRYFQTIRGVGYKFEALSKTPAETQPSERPS